MRKYIKPTIEVLELRVNENLASAKYPSTTNDTPITKYNLLNGNPLGVSN